MPSFFRTLSVLIFLFCSNVQFALGQSPVSEIVAWLNDSLASRTVPKLSALTNPQSTDTVALNFETDLFGISPREPRGNSTPPARDLKPNIQPAVLNMNGMYKLTISSRSDSVELTYSGRTVPLTQTTTIEQAPFWIRLTNSSRDTVLWKEDALSIAAYLALASSLVSPADMPVEPSRWMSVLSSLEKNSFLSAELADIRPSAIPPKHPLVHELAGHLNRQVSEYAPFFTSMPLNPPAKRHFGAILFLPTRYAKALRQPAHL